VPVVAARMTALVGSGRGDPHRATHHSLWRPGGRRVCLAALAGFELVHGLVPTQSRQRHNDVAGFIYAALGVIYAVLLALVLIAVWQQFQAAEELVEQEANATAEIAWLVHRLPEPLGSHIQELCRSYAEEVIHKEWSVMERGKRPR